MWRKLFVLLMVFSVFWHASDLFQKPISDVDEPQVLVSSVQILDSNPKAYLFQPTMPILGYAIYGLPSIFFKEFDPIRNFSPTEDFRGEALIFVQENPTMFSKLIFLERILLMLFFIFDCVALHVLANFLFKNSSIAKISTLFFAFSLDWYSLTQVLYYEVIQLGFVLVAILCLLKFLETKSKLYLLCFLSLFSVAIGIRHSSLYLLFGFLLFIFAQKQFSFLNRVLLNLAILFTSVFSAIFWFPSAKDYLLPSQLSAKLLVPNVYSEIHLGLDPFQTILAIFIKVLSGTPDFVYYFCLIVLLVSFICRINFFQDKSRILFFLLLSVFLTSPFVVSTNHSFGLISRYIIFSTIPIFLYAASGLFSIFKLIQVKYFNVQKRV